MKKLFSLILALVMLSMALGAASESTTGIVGGADAPTDIIVSSNAARTHYQTAIEAGRRVNQTISITDMEGFYTGDETADAIVDLLKALGIAIGSQGDEINMVLSISGKNVITLGGAASGEDFYLSSNMLGGTIVAGLDEIEPLLERLVDAMAAAGMILQDDAAALKESIAGFKAEVASAMEKESIEEKMLAEMDFTALEGILPMLMGKITTLEEVIVPRMCDPAVSGLQLVLTNADFHAVLKQSFQCILDNPAMIDYLSMVTGMPTEAQLEAQWESAGQLYMKFGIHESKEAYMASQETVEGSLRAGMTEIESVEILGGDMVVNVYLDDQDKPVYITATMPILVEDVLSSDPEAPMTTEVVNLTYTRQTVAQGVAHVCSIAVEDAAVTIDALVGEGSTTVSMIAAEPELEPVKLFDLSIKQSASDIHPGVTCIDVAATLYEGADTPALNIVYDGEYETSDVREYCAGKLTLKAYEYWYSHADEMHSATHKITLEFSTDTAINGIDYTTDASFLLDAEGVRFGIKLTEETADPQPSIMTGNVVRPEELNDADFANWFTGVMNAFELWMVEALQALPESLLMLLVYSGM